MRDPNLISKFHRRLVELGCPASRVERAVREMADHFEDLKAASREQGLTEAEAEVQAGSLLGKAEILAERAAEGLRQSSWLGRHRIVAFCILPLLSLPPLVFLCVAICGSLYELIEIAVGHSIAPSIGKSMAELVKHPVALASLRVFLNVSVMGILAIVAFAGVFEFSSGKRILAQESRP